MEDGGEVITQHIIKATIQQLMLMVHIITGQIAAVEVTVLIYETLFL